MKVGIIGASSIIGETLIYTLIEIGVEVVCFSRRKPRFLNDTVRWFNIKEFSLLSEDLKSLDMLVMAVPITESLKYLEKFKVNNISRIVSLSSTSRFTKVNSGDSADRLLAANIERSEDAVIRWAEYRNIDWIVLRPTMIYGNGKDGNVYEISKLVQKLRFFPLFRDGTGMRQPIHVDDVADACIKALQTDKINKSYNIAGSEVLSYRCLVSRIFSVMDLKPRLVNFPYFVFIIGVFFAKKVLKVNNVSFGMILRQTQDLVFECEESNRELGITPRPFVLNRKDVYTATQSF